MNIIQRFMTNNPCYKAGRKIAVKGLMLHSVGCPQPSATVFINSMNKSSYSTACVHGFIDANSGDVYQTLPWNHRGWHGGGSSNNTHIGVEMCEPSCIKYTSGGRFVCTDLKKAQECARRTYDSAVLLFADLCKQYNLNPLADGVVVSHKEGYQRGIAANHGDPEHLWNGLNMGYTMDKFRKDVYNAMNGKNTHQEIKWTEEKVSLIGVVTAEVLNIRKKPGADSDKIGQHVKGDEIVICAKTNNGWYKVDYPNLGDGYISGDYVSTRPALGVSAPTTPIVNSPVLDNTPNSWAKDAVEWAKDKKIITGDENGNLKLHDNCTREDVLVFLYRMNKNK